jgi:hypothetical protein
MKKLIPALAMLLVAAALMGTSTYAWFSAGTTVTADGMKIKATSSGGLAIATSSTKNATLTDANFTSTTANVASATAWNNGTTTVSPVSTDGNDKWFTAKSAAADDYRADSTGYNNFLSDSLSTAAGKTGVGYFHHSQVYVKTLNQNAVTGNTANLYVSQVTVSQGSGGNELEDALRVAFKCGNNWVVFAPNRADARTEPAGNHVAVDSTDSSKFVSVAYGTELVYGTVGTSTNALLANLTYGQNSYAQVDVYLYYEGEDANCKTVYAVNLADVTLTVEFAATVPTASN